VTWWPQLFLGLAFSWGALMGWAAEFGSLHPPPIYLYLGSICWVIAYDTIYALQDVEDDTLIGVKSTARLFGDRARLMIALFYAAGFVLWIASGWDAGAGVYFLAAAIPAALILVWQVVTLDPGDPANCMVRFRANHWVGVALLAAFWVEWKF
jgi:4-hydroxybenzoate polyprenyltransferase